MHTKQENSVQNEAIVV